MPPATQTAAAAAAPLAQQAAHAAAGPFAGIQERHIDLLPRDPRIRKAAPTTASFQTPAAATAAASAGMAAVGTQSQLWSAAATAAALPQQAAAAPAQDLWQAVSRGMMAVPPLPLQLSLPAAHMSAESEAERLPPAFGGWPPQAEAAPSFHSAPTDGASGAVMLQRGQQQRHSSVWGREKLEEPGRTGGAQSGPAACQDWQRHISTAHGAEGE